MDSSQVTLIKIARVAQELCTVLSDALQVANTLGGIYRLELSRAQFLLEKIVSSSRSVLELINQFTVAAITLDEQLEKWISANGPVICLLALNEMKRALETRQTGKISFSNIFSSITNRTPPYEKINEAIKVFDNHRSYFDYLLTLTERNHYSLRQTQVAAIVPANLLFASPSSSLVDEKAQSGTENSFVNDKLPTYSVTHFPGLQERPDFGSMSVQTVQATLHIGSMTTERRKRGTGAYEVVQVDLYKLELALYHINGFTCFSKHVDTLSQCQPGTCAWLPETIEFKSWLAGKEPFLWLQGKAGSGKSILTAFLIDHLEKNCSGEPLAFFYCDFGKEETMDAFEVMRSLLYQLLNQFRYCKVESGAVELIDELVEKTDVVPKNIVQISPLFCRVVKQFRRRPRIVIDGLDECTNVDRLLQALLQLETGSIQLLVSSRPIQVIKYRFNGLLSISLDTMAGAVSADIRLHINNEVDSHQRLASLDHSLKQELCSTLHEKADGMFRWVQCQLDVLKDCVTLQEFQKTLRSLPVGLEATYERILVGIDQQRSGSEVACRALTWLVTVTRPLTLAEITEALSINIQKRILDRGIAPLHDNALLDVLGSLVIYNEETDLVNLSHFSVKEYLLDRLTCPKLPAFRMNLRRAHKEVFQMCMFYLTNSLHILFATDGPPKDKGRVGAMCDLIPSKPLLDYVLSCGFDHLAHLEPSDGAIVDPMVILRTTIRERSLEWTHLCGLIVQYDLYKSWITPEHDFIICVLISMFPEPFLRAVLNRDSPQAIYASNPLVHAVELNKVDHARTLLLRGVDANHTGCRRNGRVRRESPLNLAIQHNNNVLVDLLLKEGSAMIPRQTYFDVSRWPLNYSPPVISSLLRADEFVEWATDFTAGDFFSYMLGGKPRGGYELREEDLVKVMRRLIQIGLDFSPKWGLRAVASAVSNKHVALLQYLFILNAPIPSGILSTEEMASFVQDLESQGVDMNAITTKGDATLRRVHDCFGTLRCWTLHCDECWEDRSVLLGVLGQPAERTVVRMISLSKRLLTCRLIAPCAYIGGHNIDEILGTRARLEEIRLGLGELSRKVYFSFLGNIVIEERFRCWLAGDEPESCLDILQQMWMLVERNDIISSRMVNWDDIDKAVTLFDQKQDQFRIIFEVEIGEEGKEFAAESRRRLVEEGNRPIVIHASKWEEEIVETAEDQGGEKQDSGISEVPTTPSRASPSISQMLEILMIVVGQTGVGKSTLINMITGVPDHSQLAAPVGRGRHGTTLYCATYSCVFTNGDKCHLWDSRGFDGSNIAPIFGWLKTMWWGSQVLALLCVRASEIGFPVHWERFREMFSREDVMIILRLTPVIVVTQMDPSVTEWETTCRDQIGRICPKLGRHDIRDVALLRVRKHRGPSSIEYKEDAVSMREHISRLARAQPPCRWWR